MYTVVTACRICENDQLAPLLSLGEQVLTGVFPRDPDAEITKGPIDLVKCHRTDGQEHCGLVQLLQAYEPEEMYGANYGYRSSLNRSMVRHLAGCVARLMRLVTLGPGDIVLDIGSNDGTLLGCYPENGPKLIGIDPTAAKFREYYRPDIEVVADFFSAAAFRERMGDRKAKIVSSVAMFYDLAKPMDFMAQVAEVLDDDGVWLFEQSYMPEMLEINAYDTICHEHVEYYALRQIKWMTDRVGLKIIDVRLNDVNGGSFAVTAAKSDSRFPPDAAAIDRLLYREHDEMRIDTLEPFEAFASRVFAHREELPAALDRLKRDGKKVVGYGASTKGNVVLQFCGIGPERLACIAEVNEDKFGCYTPGTRIPIVSETDTKATNPDCLLALPWHFRRTFVKREAEYLRGGGSMLFPLPIIEMVTVP